jgi:recombination protein RecR
MNDPRDLQPAARSAEPGQEIERLIQLLARLPGLGPRSARRAALHLVKRKDALMVPLAGAMAEAVEAVGICSTCGNIDTSDPCHVCSDPRRDHSMIIVVEDVSDLWALERANDAGGSMNALYHVLGGTLSPLDGIGPDDLSIPALVDRAQDDAVSEIIIAVNATVEGQTTAHFITDRLEGADVAISRLAHGVPVGGELDYLDEGTLSAALRARTKL